MKTKSPEEQIKAIKAILNTPDTPTKRVSEYHESEIVKNNWLSKKQIENLYKKQTIRSFKTNEGIFLGKEELHSYLKGHKDKGNKTEIFDNLILRISDVARLLGCSKGHIYNLVSQDEIPFYKKGKSLYFFYSEIQEWIMEGNL